MDQLLFLLTKRQENQSFEPASPEVIKLNDDNRKKSTRTNQQRRKSSPNPSTTSTKPKSKPISSEYISPFILAARKKAADRVKKSRPSIRASSDSLSTLNNWNSDTKAPGLFDPKLKKIEIFKPVPRRVRTVSPSTPNSSKDAHPAPKQTSKPSNSVTVRTDKDVPHYRPRPNLTVHEVEKSERTERTMQTYHHHLESSIDREFVTSSNEMSAAGTSIEVKSRATSPFDERLVELLVDEHVVDRDALTSYHPSTVYSHPPLHHHTASAEHPSLPVDTASSQPARGNPGESDKIYQPSVDMMTSMAKLMDAVGTMVTRAADSVTDARLAQRRKVSYRTINQAEGKILSSQDIEHKLLSHCHSPPVTTPSAAAAIDGLGRHQEPATMPRIPESSVIIMASSHPLPSVANQRMTKSSVMDLILTKLQVRD
jgi:hypothetical protein